MVGSMATRTRGTALIAGAALLVLIPLGGTPTRAAPMTAGASTAPAVRAELRVNQQGYLRREPKSARLMASRELGRTTFEVVDDSGHVALRGRVPAQPAGYWSRSFPAVYRLDLSALHRVGRYRVVTHGAARAASPWFEVTSARVLFAPIIANGVAFDQNQRDGDEMVEGPLNRQPSHLLDRQAGVYAWPHMVRGEDVITDPDLIRIGGPVDVEGGWADAGDYLKFTHSSAYNDVVLFSSARLLGAQAPANLLAEARHGLEWLDKMWDEQSGTLHIQVGVGSGNKQGTFAGDHDLWRLPQADDQDTDPMHRYVARRPVFDAAPAGQPISPNLAGRVSAAFALAAQHDAATDPAKARDELREAQALYARADTATPPRQLVTALPHAFYPESVWQDDMELGAVEIARAAQLLGEPATAYLEASAHWARRYLRAGSTDTLNLYDVGALAHASLAGAMRELPHGRLAVTRRALVGDLADQVRQGQRTPGTTRSARPSTSPSSTRTRTPSGSSRRSPSMTC